MVQSKAGKVLLGLLAVGVFIAACGSFMAFGPPNLFAKTSSPEFCGSCHILEPEYEAWFHAGAHRRIKCVDCHLPNDTKAKHLVWKGIDGLHDFLAFHTGRVSETIKLSAHGAGVVMDNCQRCHAETVARLTVDRQCWYCHRRLSHKRTGAIETKNQQ